jgi:predicted alpha/beta hydrolase family esterase
MAPETGRQRHGSLPIQRKTATGSTKKKKQVLFVHGAGEGAYDADAKLAADLRDQLGPNYKVHCPRMPNEAAPDAAVWKRRLAKEIAAMGNGAILVGHSAGATVAIVAIAEHTIKQRLAGLFLVSAPFCGDGGWQIEGFDLPTELNERIPAGTPIFFYHSRDDETVPIAHVGLYAKSIPGAVVRRLSGRNHQLNDDLSEVAVDIKRLE